MFTLLKSRLSKEIGIVLLIKVLLLTLIWLFFVHDQEVKVDAQTMANTLGLHSQISDQYQGVHHDQR